MAAQKARPLFRDGIMILPLMPGGAGPGGAQPPASPAPAGARPAASSPSPEALHAMLDSFAGAWLDGCRRVLMLTGASDPAWCDAARRFNALLASRGLEPMALRKASQSSRAARTVHSLFAEAGSLPRRESLLGALAAGSPDTGPDTGGGIGDGFDTRPALARIQSAEATAEGVLFAIVPRIDPDLCSGCDACVRICPPEALTLIDTPGGLSAYHVDPESCDACGLCESVCEESAIRLETMALAPKDIPLQSWACRACGVAVHGPQAAAEGRAQDGLCRICARTGHHKKLFQVLS